MAKKITTAAAKKAAAEKQATKVIRRRNEEGEVVEIEVPDEKIEKAEILRHVVTRDNLLDARKEASDHLSRITGTSQRDKNMKAALGKTIAAIDKKMASL